MNRFNHISTKDVFSISTYNLNVSYDEYIALEISIPRSIEMKIRNIEIFANGIPHIFELIINPEIVPGKNRLIPIKHYISNKQKGSVISFSDNPKLVKQTNESIVLIIGDKFNNENDNKRMTYLNDFIFEKGVYILKLTNKSTDIVSMCLLVTWEELTV